jgi:cytochrome c2
MLAKTGGATLFMVLIVAMTARAQDHDLAEGEKFYTSQCKICHGSVSQQTGLDAPGPSRPSFRLAMHHAQESTMFDIPVRLIADPVGAVGDPLVGAAGEPIAFTVPYGPHLRGVIGRPAGTVEGWRYSSTLLKTLKGMEWTEAALDVWITNTQAWVPGVYMFYKQPDADIRRKIILYLKANP